MEKIASFTVNHLLLEPGIYVSRKDQVGPETVTTFDIRLTRPNREPVLNTAEVHTLEHLGATFLRNAPEYRDSIIYFGPMGCRTGFYLVVKGDMTSREAFPMVRDLFDFARSFRGNVPGAAPRDCGNYLDMNLPMARFVAERFYSETLMHMDERNFVYPP